MPKIKHIWVDLWDKHGLTQRCIYCGLIKRRIWKK